MKLYFMSWKAIPINNFDNFFFQYVEIEEGMLPEDATGVHITGCRELRIKSGAFSGRHTLVANNRVAFQNVSSNNPLFEVSKCKQVILETHAFKNTKGPMSVSISYANVVKIRPNAFSWLHRIELYEIIHLDLSNEAFRFETLQHVENGPAAKVCAAMILNIALLCWFDWLNFNTMKLSNTYQRISQILEFSWKKIDTFAMIWKHLHF